MINFLKYEDFEKLEELYKKENFLEIASTIKNRMSYFSGHRVTMKMDFPVKSVHSFEKQGAVKILMKYLKENYQVNLYEHYIENLPTYHQIDEPLDWLYKGVKNSLYEFKPAELIQISKAYVSTEKGKWKLVNLILLSNDKSSLIEAFYNVYKKKSFTLIEKEKLELSLNKKLESLQVNDNDLPTSHQKFLTELKENFLQIHASKEIEPFTMDEGAYIKLNLNLDLISQRNKASFNNNRFGLNMFLKNFSYHLHVGGEIEKQTSIKNSSYENEELIVSFTKEENRPLVKKVIHKLLSHVIMELQEKDEDAIRNIVNQPNFFESFVSQVVLDEQLEKKQNNKTRMKL